MASHVSRYKINAIFVVDTITNDNIYAFANASYANNVFENINMGSNAKLIHITRTIKADFFFGFFSIDCVFGGNEKHWKVEFQPKYCWR